MINNLPRNVFSFLHTMWGIIPNKNFTFLSPKKIKEAKKDLAKLTEDCKAIIWILSHKDADYTETVAKCYTREDVWHFASSTAIIFEHEKIFDFCGIKFDRKKLISEISENDVLKFYVDYPPEINIMRYLYSNCKDSKALESDISDKFMGKTLNMLQAIESMSHFDSVDYAIALEDYDHPERAEKFFRTLEQTLNETITKQ
ncbi:hypothetical protein [Arsukibacterium indicum]|uniref:Uncharacterized protein n=1 Tax=Arsukibacterium indicum TaxID=2848612 RepID=A0ABS6MN32_9GAMM|nr:hypothetical protein [Arsukibacterium indicum]MBV2129707.1 hypothetical protein [Arsukibacterium indicum]